MNTNNEKTILFVVSESWQSNLLGDVFELEDYKVLYTKGGDAGLNLLLQESHLPDLIFINGFMRTPKGAWLIGKIRSGQYPELAQIPFLILSAERRISPERVAIEIGCPLLPADQALTIPVDAEHLLDVVGKILGNADV